jgi:hypothetical protein
MMDLFDQGTKAQKTIPNICLEEKAKRKQKLTSLSSSSCLEAYQDSYLDQNSEAAA